MSANADDTQAAVGETQGATCDTSDQSKAALLTQISQVVNADYDLGPVIRAEQIFGGYCNASFAVWTRREDGEHKYFVRKYNPAVTEREVLFEHALLTQLYDARLPPRRQRLRNALRAHLRDP